MPEASPALIAEVLNAADLVGFLIDSGLISAEDGNADAHEAMDRLQLALKVLVLDADPTIRGLSDEQLSEMVALHKIRSVKAADHATELERFAASRKQQTGEH